MAKSSKSDKRDHLFLVDGSSYIFRAYFAMFKAAQARGKAFTRSDGLPVGAVMNFCSMLWKLLRDGLDGVKPTHIGVVFDASGDTFRTAIYPEYKAHRDEPPADLIPQFPLMREVVKAFSLIPIEAKGYEADDLIATYTREALKAGADVTIIAGDKDLMQLVRPGVVMYDPMPGNERRIGAKEVEEKFGVEPERVVEVQALAGDSSDNIPGVPGIGIKTAALLIQEYGDLETLLKNAKDIKQDKRRESLIRVCRSGPPFQEACVARRQGAGSDSAERPRHARDRRQARGRVFEGHGIHHADQARGRGLERRFRRSRAGPEAESGRQLGPEALGEASRARAHQRALPQGFAGRPLLPG